MQIILGPMSMLFFSKHEALFCVESNGRDVYLIRLGQLMNGLIPRSVDTRSFIK